MKKIFSIILFFAGALCTNALEYTYSEWSLDYPDNIKDVLIEKEDRYLWYKENEINVEYLVKEDIHDKLYDETDIKYYESDELTIRPIELEERVIIEETKNVTFSQYDVEGLYIENINENILISEIVVYDNNRPISYNTNLSYLNDNIENEYHQLDESLYLYFDSKHNMNTLIFEIHYKKATNQDSFFDIRIVDKDMNALYLITTNPNYCDHSSCYISFEKSMFIEKLNHIITTYKYIDKLYKTYDLETLWSDVYYSNYEGYTKDETTKQTYYRYITSDAVLLDISNSIVYDENYCVKNFCRVVLLNNNAVENQEIEEIANPQTYDPLYDYIVLFIVSLIVLIFYVKNSRTNKRSKYVEPIFKIKQIL